jgi:hypothetical protein
VKEGEEEGKGRRVKKGGGKEGRRKEVVKGWRRRREGEGGKGKIIDGKRGKECE